ncbi:MAG TPA: CoA pyrophosphatase [Acidimicrobiales bacterium]|nr:CoA pyrophosphatase [Acidimicrobiales bacterium]
MSDAEPTPDRPEVSRRRFRQFIPRPSTAVAGGVAPWARVAASDRRPIPLERAVGSLTGLLLPAAVEPRPRPQAAVLVPLFERAGDTAVVLIRRSLSLMSNPGDLAFPGGRLERDERAVDAALREADEEVGLSPGSVNLLGRLAVVNRTRVRERVVPYVGTMTAEPCLRAHPGEVDAVLTLSLSDLAAAGVYWEEEWTMPGQASRLLPFFADAAILGDDVIWGMTAAVLRELLTAVLAPGPAPGPESPIA